MRTCAVRCAVVRLNTHTNAHKVHVHKLESPEQQTIDKDYNKLLAAGTARVAADNCILVHWVSD